MLAGEPGAGPGDAGLHLVGDEQDAALPAEVGDRGQENLAPER